mgnify:CR=1 FL=1
MTERSRGTLYILISSVFYASYGIWSRMMGGYFGEFSQAWTRGLVLLVFVLIYGTYKNIFRKIPREDLKWFGIIALCGGLNQAPYYYGFQSLGVGTGTVIFYAALLVGGYLIGSVVFKEKMGLTKLASLILAIIGIATIYKLSLRVDQIIPALTMITAALMGSIAAVLPKKLSGNYHELQIMLGYFIVMVVANGFLAWIFGEKLPIGSTVTPWLGQLGYIMAMLLANVTVIEGFRHVEASVGSLIGLMEIILGVLFGYLFFAEHILSTTLVGGVLIILSAALPSLVELRKK